MKYIQLSLILFVLLLGCRPTKQLQQNQTNPDNEFTDYLFQNYNGNKPGASVVVIKNGQIAFTKSYGYADLENKILATTRTNYRIASVTKQFTAMAIMILVHQGKLLYESKLTDIFPEFPEYGEAITIRQLLTHRSGLVKYNRFIEEGQTKQMLDKDVLHGLFETDSTYFRPNTKYEYSNTGYAVLAQIIEKVTKMSFAAFMEKEIFQPLDMSHSTILEIDKNIENRAYGYVVKDTVITAKDQSMTSAIQGDGGVYTSVLDYYNWDKALYTDQLIPQNELDHAFYSYNGNGQSHEKGYGYGWRVSYYKGIKLLQHGGSSVGFGSHVIRIPSEHISVAIFTNRSRRGQELPNKAKALISHFTNGKFQMPFQIPLEKEIDQNGIDKGINLYNQIKTDTLNYTITKETLFNFGVSYINNNRHSEALKLFLTLEIDYPNYFGGYYGSALVYQRKKNTEKAMEYYNKAIEHSTEKQKWASDHSVKMINELSQ